MFVDTATIKVSAGKGGNGAATFRKDGRTAKGGPDGGNGGNGGDVYFVGSYNVNDLREFRFKRHMEAPNGVDGARKNLFGRNGKDITITVPVGTTLTDLETGKSFDISRENKPLRVARGGKGGRGNYEFRSATNQVPKFAEKGEPGQTRSFKLELKIIADIGLIGLPNAGKSSLLAALTNATPAIGDYPFTTIEPNVGMMGRYAIADIPGLIEGASQGKGLGTKFLKHIEKTKILGHCIAATDTDPAGSYETVRKEFAAYGGSITGKPEIVLVSKTDLVTAEELSRVTSALHDIGVREIITYSVIDDEGIGRVRDALLSLVSVSREPTSAPRGTPASTESPLPSSEA